MTSPTRTDAAAPPDTAAGAGAGAADAAAAAAADVAPLTVAEMLKLPVLRRGRPEVFAGDDLDRRTVRWVHTSEIYDIAPLLKGGEVLLTTGLGLVGASPAALADYARALAERSLAALVLEVGRTFAGPPEALTAAARAVNLPLIALRGIVPFIDVTEEVHALLLSREVARLRSVEAITTALEAPLLAGNGVGAVLRVMAELAGCPVRLYGDDGHLVAASDRIAHDEADAAPDGDTQPQAAVALFGRPWGRVVLHGAPSPVRELIARRGAVAAAVELGRSGTAGGGSGRQRAGAQLLRDLFGRQYASADEVTGRAAALGVTVRPGHRAIGICLAVDGPRAGAHGAPAADMEAPPHRPGDGARAAATIGAPAAVSDAARHVFGAALVAELDGSVLIAATTDREDLRALLSRLADRVDAELPEGRVTAVTCGPPVGEIGSLPRSLRAAREASVLARRLGGGLRTLLSSDLGVHRLLARFASDPELATFVDEQLGPLLDYDARRDRELVRTLDVLLASGLSKAAAARSLGIRRQTLYQRLELISSLLGGLDLAARERRTAIDLALVGWRLRAAAV